MSVPQTRSVDQAGLQEIPLPLTAPMSVYGLKASTTIHGLNILSYVVWMFRLLVYLCTMLVTCL